MKSIVPVLFLMVACLSGCGQVNQQIVSDAHAEAQELKEASSFETVVQDLNTPQKVYDWMRTNITYRQDTSAADEFCDAETTFARGYGDCDDYAMFANYVLEQHGYATQVVSVYTETQGHAVCVWKDEHNKMNAISNTGVQEISAPNLMNVADAVYPDWKVYAVYPSNEGTIRPAGR